MNPDEIFRLIIKADDALKYATESAVSSRVRQARSLLEQARDEAIAIGNEQLAAQAERRLTDLAQISDDVRPDQTEA